jgi:chemotaxis protein histidine kinase CheA
MNTQHQHGREFPLVGGATGSSAAAGPHGATGVHDRGQPGYSQQTTQDPQNREHHYGRDAALGAGAAGTAGAAAYGIDQEAERKRLEKEQHEAQKQHEKDLKHEQKEHEKETKHQQKEHEKEAKHEQKEHEKEQKKAEKEHEKEVKKAEKEHEKEVKKEEKHHEKIVAAEEKKAEKQHEKEVKKHDKEEEKLEHEREKEAEKRRKQQEEEAEHEHKKKGGLFGFLHRDKNKDDDKADEQHHGRDAALGAGAAGAGAGLASEHEGHHERNRLHKVRLVDDSTRSFLSLMLTSSRQEPPESVKREQARYAEPPTSGYARYVPRHAFFSCFPIFNFCLEHDADRFVVKLRVAREPQLWHRAIVCRAAATRRGRATRSTRPLPTVEPREQVTRESRAPAAAESTGTR